jgi:hypothetical protein
MLNPLSRKDKQLSFFAVALLLAIEASAFPYATPTRLADTLIDAPVKRSDSRTTRHIHAEKNCNLVITIPDAMNAKYKIRFFDEENGFLFQVDQITDSLLVMEKSNFLHAGRFRYELYKNDLLVERNSFLIKKE